MFDFLPELSPNGLTVLEKRYLLRMGPEGRTETPGQLFQRVARFIAAGDLAYNADSQAVDALAAAFYGMMARLEFLPNSPTLMNADRPMGQLSACFALPIDDSMTAIFETLKHAALIHQHGGGTGFCFSRLRPRGQEVQDHPGVSAGPVAFMEVYNAALEAIKQGGMRQGANMGLLRVDHPDIEAFVHAKDDLRKVGNFNISVGVTDDFMRSVQADGEFALRLPGTHSVARTLRARALLDQIVDCAWRTGEPGLIFLDRINRDNPTPFLGPIEATNPCGEVPLLPYEACNLGSVNLAKMVTPAGALDWDRLAATVRLAVHFLDNVITQNRYPLPQVATQAAGNRKIGLGVMGWADCLIALGIPYASEAAVQLAQAVAAWVDYHGKRASVALAKTRGAFPNFPQSAYAQGDWLLARRLPHPAHRVSESDWRALQADIQRFGLRHATTTCIAPTGTISLIAGASGGIEPLFALAFTRNVLDNTRMQEVHPAFTSWLATQSPAQAASILQAVSRTGGLADLDSVPSAVRERFATSLAVTPAWHVRMQAAFQAFTDNGVSKTTNFPENASRAAVADTFLAAFTQGVKGITVYRNNSRADQPMALTGLTPERQPTATPLGCLRCD